MNFVKSISQRRIGIFIAAVGSTIYLLGVIAVIITSVVIGMLI